MKNVKTSGTKFDNLANGKLKKNLLPSSSDDGTDILQTSQATDFSAFMRKWNSTSTMECRKFSYGVYEVLNSHNFHFFFPSICQQNKVIFW